MNDSLLSPFGALRSAKHLKLFLDSPYSGKPASDNLWYALNLQYTTQGREYWTDRYWNILYKDTSGRWAIPATKIYPEMSEEDFAYLRSLVSSKKKDPFLLDKANKEYLVG